MAEIMTLVHTVLQWGIVAMLAKGGAMMLPLLAASVTSLKVEHVTERMEEQATRLELFLSHRGV